jgi:hypothetical protein
MCTFAAARSGEPTGLAAFVVIVAFVGFVEGAGLTDELTAKGGLLLIGEIELDWLPIPRQETNKLKIKIMLIKCKSLTIMSPLIDKKHNKS